MSDKIKIFIENIQKNYFNILYILIVPAFIIGQFIFKLIFILIIISGLVKYRQKLFNFKKNLINISFILMMLLFTFNVMFVSSYYYSINSRYIYFPLIILFFFVTNYLVSKEIISFKKIFIFYFYIIIFVILDTIYQIINLKDIFGFQYYSHYNRFSGPFGDEFILGAFMSFFLIPVILFYSKKEEFNNSKKIFFSIFLISSIYISIKSGERIAFFTIVVQFLLTYILFLNSKKSKILFLSTTVVVLVFFILDKGIQKKYLHFYQLLFDYNEKFTDQSENKNFNKISFLNTQHGAHYLTAIEIWKNNKIFGIGIKNFRNESSKLKYSNIKSAHAKFRVATHPHNYQMELLSETGLIGFIIFNLFFLFLFLKILKDNLKNRDNNYYVNIFYIIVLSKYFPFKSDASLFSSSMGLLFWMFTIFLIASYNYSQNYFIND